MAETPHKISKVYTFFCWCSGARLYILRNCPTDYNKYFGIGAIILFTGIMAAISGGFALFTVFKSIEIAVAFGIFWGMLIFCIDWFIVSSLKKNNNFGKEFLSALPRLLLAVLLAVVISRPLELKLFEQEINQELSVIQRDKIANFTGMVDQSFQEIAELQKENEALQKDIDALQERRNALFAMIIAEAEGRSPTGITGKGPVYREKREEFNRIDKSLTELRNRNLALIDQNNQSIRILKQNRQNAVKKGTVSSMAYDGFLARMEALGALASRNSVIKAVSWFIIVLFIVIESSPVLVKLISTRGAYDAYFEAEEMQKMQSAKHAINTLRAAEIQEEDIQQAIRKKRNERKLENDLQFIDMLFTKQNELNKIRIEKWEETERESFETKTKNTLKQIDEMLQQKITISEIS